MSVSQEMRSAVEAGEMEAVEERWLELLDREPLDLETLGEMARLVEESGEGETARLLLSLAEDQLSDRGREEGRLELLRYAGELLYEDPGALHDEILATLETLHGERPSFEGLAEKVGLHRAPEDIPKTWSKVDRFRGLVTRDEGTIVLMEGKGAGRVVEVNLQLDTLKVELEGLGRVGVGLTVAEKVLRPLPADHVLRRKLEYPAELREMVSEDPEGLVRTVLESFEEPLSAREIRDVLSEIVDDGEWSDFWSLVKSHPRMVGIPGGRKTYRWAESADAARADVERRFEEADLRGKLELLRSQGDRSEDLRERMVEELLQEARRTLEGDPALAFSIAADLDRAAVDLSGSPVSPDTILADVRDARRFLAGLLDRIDRGEAYRRWPGIREDWDEIFETAFFLETDRRLLSKLGERLRSEAPDRWDSAVTALLARPRRSPGAFVWLVERAAEDEELLARGSARLFRQILSALGDERFRSHRRRILRQVESGGTLPRLLPHLEIDQARRVVETLRRSPALEDHEKRPLLNAIRLRFADLASEDRESPLYALPRSIEAKREELRVLLEEEIPANRKAIEEARELGDLRENFEYKSARQRHEYLTSRAESLDRDLSRARAIDLARAEGSTVRIGTRVVLASPEGEVRSYAILGPWESDPEAGVLSHESELAGRLLGLAPGDEIEIGGEELAVRNIEPYGGA
ncbi:MAG: GreA/GreB family elongation factor [Thermoanaerobaculia bacterium]|nr:GreA/GreB family elongation factor [Thermoanaerobaculia bacterium]